MSALLTKTKLQIIAYRMAIFWFVLFSFNALGTAFLAVSSGCVWANLDGQTKVTVCVAVFVNWSNTIMAYIKQASQKIEADIQDDKDPSPAELISIQPQPPK